MKNRIIIHADFDYFYAQCEEIRKPQLRTVPVAVCVFSDRGGDSGAIATANYTVKWCKSRHVNNNCKKKASSFPTYSKISANSLIISIAFCDMSE